MLMKLLYTIVFFSLVHMGIAHTQSKEDYQWIFGNDQLDAPGFQGLRMNFNNKPFSGVEQATNGLSFSRNNASICDKEGNLLMYTNGCAVANRNHEQMMNGDSINWGNYAEFWLNGDCRQGYPNRQEIMILPDPGYDQGYYIIHKPREYNVDTDQERFQKNIRYSYVDMSLDDGLGGVAEKNITFYSSETFNLSSYLTAIAHSNGKDWWIIQPERNPDQFVIFLLEDNGISVSDTKELGFITEPNTGASGEAKFSPDGKTYALYTKVHGLFVYDFDRATGALSNMRHLETAYPDALQFSDLEFSSNSELLYLASTDSLWQVDLLEDNLADGKVLIDIPNGFADPVPTNFYDMALAPDCKIYIRTGSSVKTFDVIQEPNRRGKACNLVQQAISFPQFTSTGTFPNMPRFRVDEEEKCDPSITSFLGEEVYYRRDLAIFPNPVQDQLTITIPERQQGQVVVYDIEGNLLRGPIVVDKQQETLMLELSTLASGTYIVEYVSDDRSERLVYNQRFVKI